MTPTGVTKLPTRIIIAANRLPVARVNGEWHTSPGGLVSALVPILQQRHGSWVGWSGIAGVAPTRNRPGHPRHLAG